MKISIIHPTRGRKQIALQTGHKWLVNCDNPQNVEYLFSIDKSDPEKWPLGMYWSNSFKWMRWRVLENSNNSAIEAINNAAKKCQGDLVIVISDDFDCPEHWDTLLLQALAGKEDFIVKTRDGLQKTLITLPIMDRKYYERFGYVYHPDYLHMHCDEEMTIVGHMLGRVVTLDLLFPHNHYTTGKMTMDAINVKNNATWAHGQRTLNRRAQDNFGIKAPLVRREDIKWK